ncbi:amidohydrolase [Deltaproteobacteria bacterium]|nr:amidohydrolase [Deltaproteobacteria bacterium]
MASPLDCVADLVVIGAQVVTMNAAQPRAEAFAVADGVVVRVGSDAEMASCRGPATVVYNAAGLTVLPGFVDAHAHPGDSGMEAGFVDLDGAHSMEAVVARATAWRAAHPDAKWVQGGPWDGIALASVAPLAALDAEFGTTPVFLWSEDGHSAWVNTAALRAGRLLTENVPRGGQVVRDASGGLTGVIREAAVDAVTAVMPVPTADAVDAGITSALLELRRYGITSVIEASSDLSLLAGWRRAERAGRLTARVFAAMPIDLGEGAPAVARVAKLARKYRSERLRVNAIKLFVDGVVEPKTALMLDPYIGGGTGPVQFEDAELDELFDSADAAKLQIHAHAIGDAAVRQVLDAESRLVARRGPADRRPILAHLEFVSPVDAPRFATLGAIADLQALWAYPDPYVTALTVPVVGEARANAAYPFAMLAKAGAPLAAGSDWSVTTLNPWPAIEVAVTRRDPDAPGEVLGVGQGLTLDQIVAAYTLGGAHAIFADTWLGQIAPGFKADFVVLDRDPWAIPTEELSDVKVKLTAVDGELFSRGFVDSGN